MSEANTTKVSIEADLKEVQEYLEKLGGGFAGAVPKIQTKILSGIASEAASKARRAYYSTGLKSQSGNLRKSIKSHVFKSSQCAKIGSYVHAPNNNVYYAFAQVKGSEIKPIKNDYMRFDINGKWITKGPFKLKEHDIVEGPVQAYMNSGAVNTRIDKLLQKEITKLEKQGYIAE